MTDNETLDLLFTVQIVDIIMVQAYRVPRDARKAPQPGLVLGLFQPKMSYLLSFSGM